MNVVPDIPLIGKAQHSGRSLPEEMHPGRYGTLA